MPIPPFSAVDSLRRILTPASRLRHRGRFGRRVSSPGSTPRPFARRVRKSRDGLALPLSTSQRCALLTPARAGSSVMRIPFSLAISRILAATRARISSGVSVAMTHSSLRLRQDASAMPEFSVWHPGWNCDAMPA